ncbi:MAG: hypothetical protein RLZZ165_24 [Bacteroidota bacterium]|jgi:hypothetical protein
MFPLHPRKVALSFSFVIVLSLGLLRAQSSHYFDYRPFNLGFTMGMCVARYEMKEQINQVDPGTGRVVARVSTMGKPGVYLGLITNLRLAKYWDLRFMPSVSLEQRDFLFYMDSTTVRTDPVVQKKIESSNLNLPLTIKFKSDFYRNTRVWVQFGLQPSLNLASSKKVRNDLDLLKVNNFDLQYVASVGIDLYGEKLKLSPEFRFTRGLWDIYVPERTRFPKAISSLISQLLVFCLNFE